MSSAIENEDIPWSEKLILVCSKCGAKAALGPADINPADRIKSDLKLQISQAQKKSQIRSVTSSCLDICPEGRIAIVEITRGPSSHTRALTVDPSITAADLKNHFLHSN